MMDKPRWTGGEWAVHGDWPLDIIRACDSAKENGVASDPLIDEQNYYQRIACAAYDAYAPPDRFPHRMVRIEESKANARLIAAAPDLAKAADVLAHVIELYDRAPAAHAYDDEQFVSVRARELRALAAAYRKALGET